MVLVPLVAAPSLMFAVSAAERRFGAAVAGAMAAMPVALSVILLAVGAELGADAGATLAAGAAAHVVAQVAFALAFAAVVERRGAALGVLAGASAFALGSLLLAPLPTPLAIVLAIPALTLGSDPSTLRNRSEQAFSCERSVKGSDPLVPARSGPMRGATAVGAAAALVMVAAALTTAELAGPAAAGAIGAFPALSTAFAVLLVRTRGPRSAATALRGLIGGLRAYLVFTVTVALAAPGLGVYTAVPLALALCLITYAALLSSSRQLMK
ncbi:hypothetical protein [Solirubrobacter soli]|uniref:hypothetical protein n=1 Tax=Solirubrobacter soli TaxID=363832 RepID=UPI0003FB5024|nr:hypothetical protein [Solirubrobacter soli]